MSRGTTISVLGLYHFNDKLFDKMIWPDDFTNDQKETVIGNILSECAELECLFPDWYIMQDMIKLWSKLNYPTWNRIYKASLLEYNPIENYNRTELETIDDNQTDTINGSKVNVASGSDSLTGNQSNSGTDTNVNSQTAYDSNSLKVHDDSKLTYGHRVDDSSTTTYGRHDTLTDIEEQKRIGKITRNNHTSGNIGITTSQDMLSQEAEIAVLVNILPVICNSFKERFCLLVY